MTITLPQEKEAKLLALSLGKRPFSRSSVVEAVDKILAEAPDVQGPSRSLRGLLAKYGPEPSAEEIDRNRAEMLANFPRSDF